MTQAVLFYLKIAALIMGLLPQNSFVYLKIVIRLLLLIAMVMDLVGHNGVVVVPMEAMKLVLMERF